MATQVKKRKPRGDSKLDGLPADKKQELIQGLLANWTFAQAADWLRVECGVSVSYSAWTPFYERNVEPILVEQKQFAALSAKVLGKMAEESGAFDAAAIGELKERAYRMMRDPESDPEEARKWMETVIKAQAGSRDDRKLRILEAKAAKTDKAEEIENDKDLTEADKAVRIRQLFRMG